MQEARMLGNYVAYLAKINGLSNSDLSGILGCTEDRVYSFIKGRAFASFSQLSSLANAFDVSIDKLLVGDKEHYNETVVHCMNDFHDTSRREEILDLIDNYIDIVDAVDAN